MLDIIHNKVLSENFLELLKPFSRLHLSYSHNEHSLTYSLRRRTSQAERWMSPIFEHFWISLGLLYSGGFKKIIYLTEFINF